MHTIFERVQVIATAIMTYLMAAAVALSAFAEQLPDDVTGSETVNAWVARAVVWIGVLVVAIRRHTPVYPGDRGLLRHDDDHVIHTEV